jgi:uncharacterized protein (TIGR02594 family)
LKAINETKNKTGLAPTAVWDLDPWWVKKAFAELGQKEISGSKDNPRIVHYHSFTTLGAEDDETPWCASFVRFLFERRGGANARSFLDFGKPCEFKRGAVVVFSRDSAGPRAGHVAIALAETDTNIVCLGGNQGNAVSITTYPKSRLLGYRWPPGDLVTHT